MNLDHLLSEAAGSFLPSEGPGAAVLVMADGQLLHQGGYGLADLEERVPISGQTAFDLASVSKQFTAMGILILARRGLLSFTDDLREHLPEWPCPEEERPIRLLDLLQHTSGVPDYSSVWRGAREDFNLCNADYLEQLAAHPLDFPTGSQAEYSNSNYILLAEVLERCSGKPFRTFMAEEIFSPLQMHHTLIHDDHALVIPHRARGYKETDGAFESSDFPVILVGHSHQFTTIEDMGRWMAGLHTGRLVDPAELALAYTAGTLDDGQNHVYGFGWYHEQRCGRAALVHGGSWYGFRNLVCQFLADKLAIVVLSNNETFPVDTLVDRLAEVCFRANRPKGNL
jgi:CubicO group peptidase (beta-lactamase class C family)